MAIYFKSMTDEELSALTLAMAHSGDMVDLSAIKGVKVDKLELIPGFQTELTTEEFFTIVNTNGFSVVGQSTDLAPADKKLYVRRDAYEIGKEKPEEEKLVIARVTKEGVTCIKENVVKARLSL